MRNFIPKIYGIPLVVYYICTYCKVDAFGGHPRQFSGLSDYSQLLMADEKIDFLDRSLNSFIIFFPRLPFFLIFVFEPTMLLRTPRVKGQTELRKPQYLRNAQQNSLQSALHRGAKYSGTFVSTRQESATTQASRQ